MDEEKGKILVVDDNEMNRDMLSRRLARRGHEVETAEDGERALEAVGDRRFDLILLDIMMPGIDGFEVLKRVREEYSAAELPVIMATAKDSSEDVVRALKEGANDYVTKPLDFAVVSARVQTQISIKKLSDLKDQFFRIASHDLKNPLTTVLTGASLLPRLYPVGTPVDERALDILGRISRRAREMQRIIEDFLDFQAMESGKVDLEKAPVDLGALMAEIVENNQDYAGQKEIELRFERGPELPAVEVDADRIAQVAQNLVGNAIKFSPPGRPVRVQTHAEDGQAVVEIVDDGPGLTDEDLGKLFQTYAKLSNKPTGGEKSSGVGLSICKQLIELHGGRIGARNNPEGGATFWFRLGGA